MIDKEKLVSDCDALFEAEEGKRIHGLILKAINDRSMTEHIDRGVLVGFSGGADSVLLLIFLWKLRKTKQFDLAAVHVNHMIRDEDADRDEAFCIAFCDALGIDLQVHRVDVPRIAQNMHLGLEEAARNERYRIFSHTVSQHNSIGSVAVAHNATDNSETFIFNMLRGTGLRGLTGISPVRGNVFRPLILISKADITKLLCDGEIPFVTDMTNFSVDYSRNYIRHEILPRFAPLTPSYDKAISRVSSNLSVDDDYLSQVAKGFFEENFINGTVQRACFADLHKAIMSRVIVLMAKSVTDAMPEHVHIDKICSLIAEKDKFRVDLPGQISFFADRKHCYISKGNRETHTNDIEVILHDGLNEIPQLGIAISVADSKNADFSSNVYNFSIQANLGSAIIFGDLSVRTRRAGDSYFYGGMKRRVKKLFCDKKLTESEKRNIPIICDDNGIVWIPGFGVRDDRAIGDRKSKWITVYNLADSAAAEQHI